MDIFLQVLLLPTVLMLGYSLTSILCQLCIGLFLCWVIYRTYLYFKPKITTWTVASTAFPCYLCLLTTRPRQRQQRLLIPLAAGVQRNGVQQQEAPR